ncbi:TerD family protein [Actinomadura oligospora]|uniref:TerD family protein n=1 Tax=Actinomadura oligospora TaxID=111804 RepID=UPI00047A26BB
MGVPLTGGDGVPLPGSAPPALSVGFGWTPPEESRADFDVDAAALMLDDAGAVLSEDHFVHFNNPRSPDGSVEHRGPAPDGPGETIDVDLAAVPDRCARIAFPVSIFDAANRAQRLGQVRAVSVRVTRRPGGPELARYDLPARRDDDPATAVLIGALDRGAEGWTFRAVGRGYPGGLREIAHDHGLPVR